MLVTVEYYSKVSAYAGATFRGDIGGNISFLLEPF